MRHPLSRRRSMRRYPRAPLGIILAVLAFTGCASSTVGAEDGRSSKDPATVVAAAYDKTLEATTMRFSISQRLTVPVDGRTETIETTGEGVTTLDGRTMRLKGTTTQVGDYEAMMLDGIEYVRYADQEKLSLPPGKTWIRFDLRALLDVLGVGINDLAGPSGSDPRQGLAFLHGVVGIPRVVGEEDIRGVRATRYTLVVDPEKAAAERSSTAAKTLSASIATQTFPADVWIDSEGRIIQMAYSITMKNMSGSAAGSSMTVGNTIGFFDYGVPLGDITPPPADQVEDITDKIRNRSRQGGGSATG